MIHSVGQNPVFQGKHHKLALGDTLQPIVGFPFRLQNATKTLKTSTHVLLATKLLHTWQSLVAHDALDN